MNLIYLCVFHQEGYIQLLKLLINSMHVKSNINKETTDILIVTSPSFQSLIQKELDIFDLPIHYYILDLHTLFEAGCARLNIFNYENIEKYDNILYIDTDILINSDLNILFNLEISSDKLYGLEEGNLGHEFWGGQFFDFTKYDRKQSGFTSGILLFKNSNCMKILFSSIQSHIEDYVYINKNNFTACLDQPFIVYNAISQNKYNNKLLNLYVENNPSFVSSYKIIYHFPGGPGEYDSKLSKMDAFWEKIIKIKNTTIIDNKMYSWENENINFLENGQMDAFGIGSFKEQDTYLFEANFGGRIHSILFNNDYSEFISTRCDDSYVVKGKLIKNERIKMIFV